MRKPLIAVVVLAILLVAADRISRYVAQRKLASRLGAAYDLASPPIVTITGFPFLTQVIAGRYGEVDVAMGAVERGGVKMKDLAARFMGVHAPLMRLLGRGGAAAVTADQATATALLPFEAVQQRLPTGITLSADGEGLRLSGNLGYQGFQVPVSAGVSLRVTSAAIEVSPRDLKVGGSLSVRSLVGNRLAISLPVSDLPMQLKVRTVQVTRDGFAVSASAGGAEFEPGD
jgi:LmeA-like phospholipid-binding